MSDGIRDGLNFGSKGQPTEYALPAMRRRVDQIQGETYRSLFLTPRFPTVLCLIGSSRFKAEFQRAGETLEKSGKLAIAMMFFQHADGVPVTEEDRVVLDRLDFARIDLSDEVVVIAPEVDVCRECGKPCRCYFIDPDTVSGCCDSDVVRRRYVGESTRRELEYATRTGKPVRYWEDVP